MFAACVARADKLRSQTESYFHKYSQFATATNIPPKPTEDEKQTEASIQDLLEKVRALSYPLRLS